MDVVCGRWAGHLRRVAVEKGYVMSVSEVSESCRFINDCVVVDDVISFTSRNCFFTFYNGLCSLRLVNEVTAGR